MAENNTSTQYNKTNQMQSSFQDGVDSIYNAIVAQGVTPSNKTPGTLVTSIGTVATNKYNAGNSAGYNSGYSSGYNQGVNAENFPSEITYTIYGNDIPGNSNVDVSFQLLIPKDYVRYTLTMSGSSVWRQEITVNGVVLSTGSNLNLPSHTSYVIANVKFSRAIAAGHSNGTLTFTIYK